MKEKKYNYVYAVVNFTQRLAYKGTRRRANQYVLPTETTPLCIDA